tara:strand:+ start:1998 stop:3008 length:1011 start_codon:yes stop_codon:yes gene_type:complete
MSVYGKINVSDFELVETEFHKTKLLDSASEGVSRISALSSSLKGGQNDTTTNTTASNHWHALRTLFYSGSYHTGQDMNEQRYPLIPIGPKNQINTNKFDIVLGNNVPSDGYYTTASVFYIPQKYFGERIQPGSFTLTDNSHPSGTMTIKDDGFGNLYPVDPYITQSNNSVSHSDNYIGNIFYDMGVALITQSGSFSGSGAERKHQVMYQDVGSGNYELKFNSTQHYYIRQWTIRLKPNSWMQTMNPTARGLLTASNTEGSVQHIYSHKLLNKLTGSNWAPYLTGIQLYNDTELKQVPGDNGGVQIKHSEPLVIAQLPRPVKMRDDMSITFKIKMDY